MEKFEAWVSQFGVNSSERKFAQMAWQEAVKQERERCAKVCENYEGTISECMGDIEGILAAKIRART